MTLYFFPHFRTKGEKFKTTEILSIQWNYEQIYFWSFQAAISQGEIIRNFEKMFWKESIY